MNFANHEEKYHLQNSFGNKNSVWQYAYKSLAIRVFYSKHVYFILFYFSSFLLLPRILCETVKDFVAKIGKTYEKPVENADEADAMAIKVRLWYFLG